MEWSMYALVLNLTIQISPSYSLIFLIPLIDSIQPQAYPGLPFYQRFLVSRSARLASVPPNFNKARPRFSESNLSRQENMAVY